MNLTNLKNLLQAQLNVQALGVIAEVEQAAARLLIEQGRKMLSDEKRALARTELHDWIEVQDDKLGPWADQAWFDALEEHMVDLAITTAFAVAGGLLNQFGRHVPADGAAPVVNAPEQASGGLE